MKRSRASLIAWEMYPAPMLVHPSEAASDRESIRLTKIVKRIGWLPVSLLFRGVGAVKRLFVAPKSDAEQRVKEKERQAGIRRELRGLPAHHDEGRPAA